MNKNILKVDTPNNLYALNADDDNSINKPEITDSTAKVVDSDRFIKQLFHSNVEKAFQALFTHHYVPLCNLAVRYIYSKQEAEDLVSDVFYDFLNKKRYETLVGSLRNYLFQAVRYKVYRCLKNEYADNKTKKIVELNDFESFDRLENDNPQAIMMFNELLVKINESVQELPPQCSKVFLLSRFEGKKNKEISEKLGIKLKTVESHMKKALAVLKENLKNYINK